MHAVRNKQDMEKFGRNLRKVRLEKGMTQEQLAGKAELAVSQVGRIETGNLNTSICTVYNLLRALEVDANELFDEYIENN